MWISTQVLLETWWVLTSPAGPVRLPRKPPRRSSSSSAGCRWWAPTRSSCARAVRTARRRRLAVWDAMIIEAARSAGCTQVLSEDLQHDQDIGGVVVVNPFLD